MNTLANLLERYSGPFLKWMREEFQKMEQRTRKLMTMHEALHPRYDIGYMCQEKKKEEDSPALKIASIQRLKDYLKKSKERQITATRNSTENIKINRMLWCGDEE